MEKVLGNMKAGGGSGESIREYRENIMGYGENIRGSPPHPGGRLAGWGAGGVV